MEHYSIDELVFRYQDGDERAGEELLKRFGAHPKQKRMTLYVGKYYNMLRYGKINFKDYDSRMFIACYMPDAELRKKMRPFYQYRGTKENAILALQGVVDQLKVVEDEDLEQDLRMLLLIQATRYQKTKKHVDFTGYLYRSYRYAVYNHFDKMLKKKDPHNHLADYLVRFQDDVYGDDDSEIEVDESIFAAAPMIQLDDELGNSWVRGITCGDEFKDLTPLQRMILKLHYQDGVTDGKIANMMGIHINTIFRQRKKAMLTIEETIAKLLEEDE